jgi:hypothetical protein
MAEILDFPQEETVDDVETEEEFPMHLYGYITAVADGVFGDEIGFHAQPAKTDDGKNVVVMIVGSLKVESIRRKAVFNLESMEEVRKACIVLAYEILLLEEQHQSSASKLLVPDKKIFIPGQ